MLNLPRGQSLQTLLRALGGWREAYAFIATAFIIGVLSGIFLFSSKILPMSSENTPAGTVDTPLPASLEISELSDVFNDLEQLDCVIINATQISGEASNIGIFVEYNDFRKLACGHPVFYYQSKYEQSIFFTFHETSIVVWGIPPEMDEDDVEPVAQTQVRIDMLDWDVAGNTCTITVRNTGNVPAQIESLAIRKNVGGSPYTIETDGLLSIIQVGGTEDLTWDEAGLTLAYDTSYVVRVTASSGFYYEMVTATPSPS